MKRINPFALFAMGIIILPVAKAATKHLISVFSKYFRYNIKAITKWTVRVASLSFLELRVRKPQVVYLM